MEVHHNYDNKVVQSNINYPNLNNNYYPIIRTLEPSKKYTSKYESGQAFDMHMCSRVQCNYCLLCLLTITGCANNIAFKAHIKCEQVILSIKNEIKIIKLLVDKSVLYTVTKGKYAFNHTAKISVIKMFFSCKH